MQLKDEHVHSVLEFAPNFMIIHVAPTDLLIAKDWRVIGVIKETESENFSKYMLLPFPSFEAEEFPFILCAGRTSLNIVNVKEFKMQVLIRTATWYNPG